MDPKMGHKFSLKIKLYRSNSKRAYSTYRLRNLRVQKFNINDLSHTNLNINKKKTKIAKITQIILLKEASQK